MEATDSRSELRGAVFRGDHETLIALLQANWVDDALQLAGDGLVAAVRAECAGAAELARRCAASLRERDWDGDAELASSLETSLGIGAEPSLRQLPVDLEDLSMILEGDPVSGGGRIDLETGEVWPQPALDYAEEMGELDSEDEDDDRWLWVSSEGSRAGYRDMEWFIADMADSALARRLEHAIRGRGAFRRFKVALAPYPELADRWHAFSEERHRGRARSWLADQGFTPAIV